MSYIDGLKVQISSQELKEHLLSRVAYHSSKADAYARSKEGVKEAQSDDEENNYSNNPQVSLGQSERKHRNQAAYFLFIADHLVTEVTYQLDQNDLIKIEVMDRW